MLSIFFKILKKIFLTNVRPSTNILLMTYYLFSYESYRMALCWTDIIHNERDGISTHHHQHLDCLLNCLVRHRSKKTSKVHVTGLWEGNPPITGGFPSQRASNTEKVSMWWHHHEILRNIMAFIKVIDSTCCIALHNKESKLPNEPRFSLFGLAKPWFNKNGWISSNLMSFHLTLLIRGLFHKFHKILEMWNKNGTAVTSAKHYHDAKWP